MVAGPARVRQDPGPAARLAATGAAGRSSRRSTRRSRRSRSDAVLANEAQEQQVRARRGAGPARYRPGQGDGGQPHVLARPEAQPAEHQRVTSAGTASRATTRTPWRMLDGGGDLPGYQAGSTFKIFTMLAALDMGYTLNMSFFAPEKYRSIYLAGSGPASCGGHWCPENASAADTGRQNMWSGFGMSVNTYWVQVEQKIGAAERGRRWPSGSASTSVPASTSCWRHRRTRNGWGAFTLGVADTTPLEIANAFATDRRRGHLLPAAAGPVDHRPGRQAGDDDVGRQDGRRSPRRAATGCSARTWPGRRPTRRAA